jgi:hypothetical protein
LKAKWDKLLPYMDFIKSPKYFWKLPLFNSQPRIKPQEYSLSTPTTAKLWYQDQRTFYWVWFFRALPKIATSNFIKHVQSKSEIALENVTFTSVII